MVTPERETLKRIDVPKLVEWFRETGWQPIPHVYVGYAARSCCLIGALYIQDTGVTEKTYPGGAFSHVVGLGFDPQYLDSLESGFMGYSPDGEDGDVTRFGYQDGKDARAELISANE